MEGDTLQFLSVPLKKSSEVSLVRPLKNVITTYFKNAEAVEKINESVNELNKLRNDAVWKAHDRTDTALDVCYSYYDQLLSLESKVPPSEIQIPFKWKDAFVKGSLFSSSVSLTINSIAYEKICVLFNIAAMQSRSAASKNVENDDSLKSAAKLFQQSAGIYKHLRGCVMSTIQQTPTPDLYPETLHALSAIMLAQAQEAFTYKAMKDKMKNAIIAKLCSQTDECYADALKLMQKDESTRAIWDKEWLCSIAGKQAAYHGLACFYQGHVEGEKKNIGEQIARYEHTMELLKAAESRSGNSIDLSHLCPLKKVKSLYDSAKKDNEFIYHARVPDYNSLPSVPKAALAKIIDMPAQMSKNFQDLFETLLPVPVHIAMSAYDQRKSEIVNTEVGKLREATQLLNSLLANHNLPAALEDSSGKDLPQSLKDKAAQVRDTGGVDALEVMLKELPELLQRNKEILDEAERMMREEKESDDQLRQQFKERWTRKPSSELTEQLMSNATKYRSIIETAMSADGVVREKFNKHRDCIYLLSLPERDLISAIPTDSGGNKFQESPAVNALRVLMEEVETLKAERDVIESELKSATTDMKEVFLNSLKQDGSVNEPVLSMEALGRVYGSLQQQVKDSLSKQETLIVNIQSHHGELSNEKGTAGDSRESKLKDLAAAYDAYDELRDNLTEGTKFYNDLTQLLVNFQTRTSDFVFARKTEKEDIMRDLTSGIANTSMPAPPTRPPRSRDNAPPPSTAPPPPQPQEQQPTTDGSNLPYPLHPTGIPVPYGAQPAVPYPVYTPMPGGYNPYGTYPPPRPVQGYPPQNYPGYSYPPQQQQPPQYPPQQQYPGYPYPQQPQWR